MEEEYIIGIVCTKCEKELSAFDFSKDRTRKNNLSCWCKECVKTYQAEHKEKIRAQQKDWVRLHPAEVRDYGKAYYEKHRPRIIEKQRERNARKRAERSQGSD